MKRQCSWLASLSWAPWGSCFVLGSVHEGSIWSTSHVTWCFRCKRSSIRKLIVQRAETYSTGMASFVLLWVTIYREPYSCKRQTWPNLRRLNILGRCTVNVPGTAEKSRWLLQVRGGQWRLGRHCCAAYQCVKIEWQTFETTWAETTSPEAVWLVQFGNSIRVRNATWLNTWTLLPISSFRLKCETENSIL